MKLSFDRGARAFTSLVLAAALLLGCVPAYASEALGHDLDAAATLLSEGTALASGAFWSDTYSDLRRENYVVYVPNERVKPLVSCGGYTRELTTVEDAASALEAQGLRVVAGINGDYYGTQHGVPLGSTMSLGELRNINGDKYCAVGFLEDGSAVIGDPELGIEASVNGAEGFPVFAFNHIRQSGYGVFLYDSRFNDRGTTGTNEPGVDVLCSVTDGALTIGGSLTLRVEEVLPEATDTAVPEGMYVLTANLSAPERYTEPLGAMQPGDCVVLSVTSGSDDPRWNETVELIGAPQLLLENGEICEGLPTGSAPRTAIGQRGDGSLVFYTIDGRAPGYSIGATLAAVAERLAELGCVTAAALDGGGSTTLAATLPDETHAHVVNSPSEGSARAVSNHLFLVASAQPGGAPDHIYVSAGSGRAMPGAKLELRAAVVDTAYLPTEAFGAVTLSADGGSLDENGVLTLPDTPSLVTVTASCGTLSAQTTVEAVLPDRIAVGRGGSAVKAITLSPGETAELWAKAYVNHLLLTGDNSCFDWSFEGEGATLVPQEHTLYAGTEAGVGTLRVSAGEVCLEIPVTVAPRPFVTVESFETPFGELTSPVPEEDAEVTEASALRLSHSTDAAHVRFGRGSARLDYDLKSGLPAWLPLSYSLSSGYERVELWAYGDGGGASVALETDAGVTEPYALSFTGWAQLSFELPKGARTLTGLTVFSEDDAAGTVWLDQLVLAYGPASDGFAPDVSLSLDAESGILSGRAFDSLNGASLSVLRLTLDGEPLAFERDARSGELTASLPEADALAHHVALTAGDACGNLARASVLIPASPDAAPAFPDAAGHWAAGAIEYLKRTGVSNGSDGLYKPDNNISRQEFAVMLYRYLAPETDCSDVELPFADAGDIAPWALDAACTMYALGIIGGAKDLDGRLCFYPDSGITRQEAVTMLGRLTEKGYETGEPGYADSADIQSWAAEHVALLASLGVLDDFVNEDFLPAQKLTRAEMASMLLRLR